MSRLVSATCAAALALATLSAVPAQADPVTSAPDPAAGPAVPGPGGPPAPDALTRTRTPALRSGLRVAVRGSSPAQVAMAFLAGRRADYRISRPRTDLRLVGTSTDRGQTAVRLAQRYHGIPVLGAEYVVRMHHRGDAAVVTGTSGRYFTGLAVDLRSAVRAGTARLVARGDLRGTVRPLHLTDRGPVVLPFGPGLLTRHVTVSGRSLLSGLPVRKEVYVAAGRSRPVLSYDSIDFDGPVTTTGAGYHGPALPLDAFQVGSSYVLRDTTRGKGIETFDARGADVMDFASRVPASSRLVSTPAGPFPASANTYGAIDAQWGAARVYDFYRALGRNGLDGHGGPIRSYVDVTDQGHPFPNAFWDGHEMVYGSGGDGYRPFAAALDVVGHEMTHGVVEHTARLLGFGQPGALNEAVADYFGNSIENATLGIGASSPLDGLMGQDLCLHRSPAHCADRDLDTVRTTRQFFGDPMDDGGVHENSTIVSGAFWQLRRILGDERADRVMYAVMTQYLTPLSDFVDARQAVLAAASAQHATAAELGRIRQAFDRRGVRPGWERRELHVDSRTLFPAMSLGSGLSVAHGHWVIADAGLRGDRLPAIYVGNLRHEGHRRISPRPGSVYDQPATDGRSVAWSATDVTHGQRTRIQVRRLSGGPVHTLATYRRATVWAVAVDGATVAWEVSAGRRTDLVVRRPDGRRHVVREGRGRILGPPSVLGDQVVWSDNGLRRAAPARLVSYDTRTGTTRVLASVRRAGPLPPTVSGPAVTARRIFFAVERGRRNMRSEIVSTDRAGRHLRVVVPGRGPHAPVFPDLTASDRAVTFSTMSSFHLFQVPADGGRPVRMSCSKGLQGDPASAGGTRVVWSEFTTGTDDLVTRARPAGRC